MSTYDYTQIALRVGMSVVPLLVALWDLAHHRGETHRCLLVVLAAGTLVTANVLRLLQLEQYGVPASVISTTTAGLIFVEYLRRARERAAAARARQG